MKILVVDSFSDLGHNQFNSIQIRTLNHLGNSVYLVGKKNHFPSDVERIAQKVYCIPNCLFNRDIKNSFGSFWDAIWEVIRLLYIRLFIYKKRFDYILFLRYNPLVHFLFYTSKTCFLFNHYSATELTNPLKRFCVLLCPNNFIHLALNDYIKGYIQKMLPNRQVFTVQHGLLEPFVLDGTCSYVNPNDKFVFCSATSSCDNELLSNIVESQDVVSYLETNNISLIIKSKLAFKECAVIKPISGFISNEDYKYLISKSLCVFLPYDKSFGYRVSGVFFECVANNTFVLASNIPAFNTYKHNGAPLYTVKNAQDFLRGIKDSIGNKLMWDKSFFSPEEDWNGIQSILL